ncbi:interferon a3-like [Myxocyprinus asiaticus]|uniref:interferon a3-like n=1 Tax=Myxocyprinus asiaticus TaxID=70543 RepID=UPI0022225F9D|nr:interferon a3-like [Myxocyprinus asiaticus]
MEEKRSQEYKTASEKHYQPFIQCIDKWIQSSVDYQDYRMFRHLVHLCLFLSVCRISSVMSCRWIKRKFQHHHGVSLDLIGNMGEKITENQAHINPIPYEMINNHRSAEPEKQILFAIQILVEITGLFEDAEDAPWDDKKMEDFLNVVHEEINGLRSCGDFKIKRNKKLHLYFERLIRMTQLKTENVGKSWEIVRKRVISLMNQLEFFSFHTHP